MTSAFFPKVKFTEITLFLEIDLIYNFLFNDSWGWEKYIIRKYPQIKEVYKIKKEKDRKKFLKEHIIQFRKFHKKEIEGNKFEYQESWEKIEKRYFELLADILNVNWPKNRKYITAMISINPICPRFLDNWSFSVFYNYKKKGHLLEVIMHECCHFLYFKKWKELYPKTGYQKFNSPFIEWHLSEIIAPIILNDRRVQKILKHRAEFYKEHSKIRIKGKSVPKYFAELYSDYINKGSSIERFLEESYSIIKNNRKLFK